VNAWAWLLQRISAFVLLIVLGLHIGFLHFAHGGEVLRFSEITARLGNTIFITLDVLLLIFGLYHALYGLYAIFVDFGFKGKGVFLGLLVLVGIGFLSFGIYGFWTFLV
jgi:succinate dehydrogenase hydrophobic anchor subunit